MNTNANPTLERAKALIVQAVHTYKTNTDIDVFLELSKIAHDDPAVCTMISNFMALFYTMEDTFQEYDA